MVTSEVNYHQILENATSPKDTQNVPYEDVSREIIIFHTVFPAVTLVFLLLRNYSRLFFLRSPGWDDLLVNLAWLFTAIMEIMVCYETKYGIGKHIQHVPVEHRMKLLYMVFMYQIIYFVANLFIKSALFVFYLRIAVQGPYKKACYGFMILNFCVFLGSLFASIFLCQPVQFFWDRRVNGGNGTCGNVEALYVSNAILNMLMDVATLVLPIPIVWGSPSLTQKTKIKISAIFLIGLVTCICSALRIFAIRPVAQIGTDVTWLAPTAHKWSTIEMNTAVIAACIPAIKPLVSTLLGRATPISRSGKSGSGHLGNAQKMHDTWVTGSGAGGVTRTSVSAVKKDGGKDRRRGLSRSSVKNGDRGMGEHILLEETLSVNVSGNGNGAWSSMESVLTTQVETRSTSSDDREKTAGMGLDYK